MPKIMELIDPRQSARDDRLGWRYEGFFLEVVGRNGEPVAAVFNHWRGKDAGGGQWAQSGKFPYQHM
ncbi:MAG TPA: hypothetical protein VMB53_07280 [Gaiellaceae bacterium]|nr:hypothetical protein [Gaiellaceae bacterium]